MTRPRADSLRGWVIWDGWEERPYIARAWPSEAAARTELATLLRGYPEQHLWRRVLTVREVGTR